MKQQVLFHPQAYEKCMYYANTFGGRGLEFILIPIVGILTKYEACPVDLITGHDIQELYVYDYIFPKNQVHGPAYTRIEEGSFGKEEANAEKILEEVRLKYPRLGLFMKTHCHPFGMPGLSGGDLLHNSCGDNFASWMEQTGLACVPMQVIYWNKGTWAVATHLALGHGYENIPHPKILLTEMHHTLAPTFSQDLSYIKWKKETGILQKGVKEYELGHGWIGLQFKFEECLLAFPPSFPMGRVYFYNKQKLLLAKMHLPGFNTLTLKYLLELVGSIKSHYELSEGMDEDVVTAFFV